MLVRKLESWSNSKLEWQQPIYIMASAHFKERFRNKSSTIDRSGEMDFSHARAVAKGSTPKHERSQFQASGSQIVTQKRGVNNSYDFNYSVWANDMTSDILQQRVKRGSLGNERNLAELAGFQEGGQFYIGQHVRQPIIHQTLVDGPVHINQSSHWGANEIISHISPQPNRRPIVKNVVKSALLTIGKGEDVGREADNSRQSHAMSEIIRSSTLQQKQAIFRPYTLKDYNNIKESGFLQLGGLGPYNIGTEEWFKRKQFQDRRLQYGAKVKAGHSSQIQLPPRPQKNRQRSVDSDKRLNQSMIESPVKRDLAHRLY